MSCTNEVFTKDAKGFNNIEQDLKAEFGEGAFYTDVSIEFNVENESFINVIVTKDPHSLKMKGFKNTNRDWLQASEVTLELEKGEIENYMFTLHDNVSVAKIGNLIDASIASLTTEESLEFALTKASVIAPVNGKKEDMLYHIKLKTTDNIFYNFWYDMNGDVSS